MAFWNPLDEPQDWVDFGGQITPGIAEIVGAGTPRRWDERDSYGVAGALVVYHGLKLSHFSVKLRLVTTQDWEDWYAFKPFVDKVPVGKRQGPIDITHPLLQQAGIRSVVVEDVLQPVQVEDGIWEIEIQLIEYRKPRLSLSKPEGAKATPADPEDADLAANREQIAALSGQQP
jgi:hypothetical protein